MPHWIMWLGIASLIIGAVLTVASRFIVNWCRKEIPLLRAEVEAMRRYGLHPGEEEYMRTFRVADSEADLRNLQDLEHTWKRVGPYGIGLTLLSIAIIIAAYNA